MLERADFHVHYRAEDVKRASCLVEVVGSKLEREGVKAVALLGRTEVVGEEVRAELERGLRGRGVDVVFGVESYGRLEEVRGVLVDLVGLGFDHKDEAVRAMLGVEGQQGKNAEIARRQQERLLGLGFCLVPEGRDHGELLRRILGGEVAEKAIGWCEIIARQRENEKLIAGFDNWLPFREEKYKRGNGRSSRVNHLFEALFSPPSGLAYFPVHNTAREVIRVIKEARGVVLYSLEGELSEEILRSLLDLGIDGVMGWHGGELQLGREWVGRLRSSGKLVLGGSDFDPKKDGWQPGVGRGEMFISLRRMEELKEYLKMRERTRGLAEKD